MNKSRPFPWHYYIRSVRSKVFYITITSLLTYVLSQHYSEDLLSKLIFLILGITLIAFIHSFFRTIPLRNLISKFNNMNMQLPHDKKLSIIYEKDEWVFLQEIMHLAEQYIIRQQEFIDNQSEQSNTILETIPTSVVIVDKYENCIEYNSHFKHKFLRDLNNSPLDNIKTFKIFNSDFVNSIASVIKSEQTTKYKGLYFHVQKEFYDVAITPIYNQRREVIGALGIFHNVTESKLTEKMRVDFVANVSHEIRTPLTSIKGYTQLLQAYKDKVGDEVRPILEKIDRNSDRLQDLFDNLLKLSVIESKYELKRKKIQIKGLLNLIEHNIKAKYLSLDINFIFDFEIESIYADDKLIEQLFTNLVDNAVKYANDEKKILISIKVKSQQNSYIINVCDNGPGIHPEKISRIFERFYRVQGSSKKHIEGSGLGLSIVKHIVNKHQGEISVESKLNQGSCFTIKLPQ